MATVLQKKMVKSNYQHKAYTYSKVQIKTKRYQNMNMECVRLTWFIQRINVNCMMEEWRDEAIFHTHQQPKDPCF